MTSNEYWKKRAVMRMYEAMQNADITANEIAKVYSKASDYLSTKAEGIFEGFRSKYHLSDAEARRLLKQIATKQSLDVLIMSLQSSDVDNKKEIIMEIESAAFKARFERLLELQAEIDLLMVAIYQQEKLLSTQFYKDLAEDTYYRTIFDVQHRSGIGTSFTLISDKQIDAVLNMDWSGQNYSKRIWVNTKKLAEKVKEEMLVGLLTGKTYKESADDIAKQFAGGASNARRLIRTEGNYVSGEINSMAYKEAEIEEYQYLATLDMKTCTKCCRQMDGRIFKISERRVGFNYPPMHPWCRCTTISIVNHEYIEKMTRVARNPLTGQTYKVPRSMRYDEWYKRYVESAEIEAG